MKQSETLKNINILNVIRLYKSIGINLQINLHQNEYKKEIPELTNHNKNKHLENFIVNEDTKPGYIERNDDKIDELEDSFKNFNGCNLKKTATNFIRFQGSKKANILFIDGPPDTEEDKVGKSFVSSKGNLFEKMLSAINLKKEDIFIINAIPWRPPGNRYPTAEEIKICRPFIFNLIKLLSPKIIVCLGEVSTNQILDLNQSIVKTRGKWHSFLTDLNYNFDSEYKPYILPTLNISYLLSRPDMKKKAWEDMKLLRDKIREI